MGFFTIGIIDHTVAMTAATAPVSCVLGVAIATLAASYAFGSIPWSFIIGRLKGVDLRKVGSGNLGATNVTRVLGKPFGVLCFFLDFLKGLLPALAAKLLVAPAAGLSGNTSDVLLIAAVVGAMTGHIWSMFLGFKGGKGVATGAGALAAVDPLAILAALILWVALFKISRYVSLASVVAAVFLPGAAFALSSLGVWPLSPILLALLILACLLTIIKHRSNIARLIDGTENRFERK